ncbi:TPA: hypothetical protein QCO65_005643 [Bacillus cereus]|uniref:hypothetical protein n=1 Tax=Bacillus sp. FSL H8-0545 TaxID=2921402 RepID=UPI0030FAAF22|nr:hypothetical protein [Bacillus cereus]
MERFDDMEINEKDGDTHTRGTYIISKDREFYDIHIGIKVIKSGMAGTGYGSVFMVVETTDGEKHIFGPLTKTVGAKIPEGVNKDEGDNHYRTKLAFDDPNEVISWYLVVGASNTRGFPDSIPSLKESILENAEFIHQLSEIGAGKSQNIEGLNVTRTTKR